jgi:hypothetical protein
MSGFFPPRRRPLPGSTSPTPPPRSACLPSSSSSASDGLPPPSTSSRTSSWRSCPPSSRPSDHLLHKLMLRQASKRGVLFFVLCRNVLSVLELWRSALPPLPDAHHPRPVDQVVHPAARATRLLPQGRRAHVGDRGGTHLFGILKVRTVSALVHAGTVGGIKVRLFVHYVTF